MGKRGENIWKAMSCQQVIIICLLASQNIPGLHHSPAMKTDANNLFTIGEFFCAHSAAAPATTFPSSRYFEICPTHPFWLLVAFPPYEGTWVPSKDSLPSFSEQCPPLLGSHALRLQRRLSPWHCDAFRWLGCWDRNSRFLCVHVYEVATFQSCLPRGTFVLAWQVFEWG